MLQFSLTAIFQNQVTSSILSKNSEYFLFIIYIYIYIYYTLHNHRSTEGLKIRLQDTLMCLYRHRFVISIWPTRAGFSKNKNEVAGKIA